MGGPVSGDLGFREATLGFRWVGSGCWPRKGTTADKRSCCNIYVGINIYLYQGHCRASITPPRQTGKQDFGLLTRSGLAIGYALMHVDGSAVWLTYPYSTAAVKAMHEQFTSSHITLANRSHSYVRILSTSQNHGRYGLRALEYCRMWILGPKKPWKYACW